MTPEQENKLLKSIDNIDRNVQELVNIFTRLEKDYSSDPTYLEMIGKEGIAKMPP